MAQFYNYKGYTINKAFRWGYQYWRIQGSRAFFTTLKAAKAAVDKVERDIKESGLDIFRIRSWSNDDDMVKDLEGSGIKVIDILSGSLIITGKDGKTYDVVLGVGNDDVRISRVREV